MPYAFDVMNSQIRLPKQRQDATLSRLGEAISNHPLLQSQVDCYLYEYRKHKGDTPLAFVDMLDLWGWHPTFDPKTNDLIALTSFMTEITDERTLRLFFDMLVPDLEDGNLIKKKEWMRSNGYLLVCRPAFLRDVRCHSQRWYPPRLSSQG